MKKIYKLDLVKCDYDQFDGFIVVAENEEEAVNLVMKEHPAKKYGDIDWGGGYTVVEIDLTESKILLGSFNAG